MDPSHCIIPLYFKFTVSLRTKIFAFVMTIVNTVQEITITYKHQLNDCKQ